MNVEFPKTEYIGCVFPKSVYERNAKIETASTAKVYTYKLLPGMETPKVGDLAVVACSNGIQVAVVKTLNAIPYNNGKDAALVIGFVDPGAYHSELQKAEDRKQLHHALMAMKKKLDEDMALEIYADRSPEFKKLLEAYNALL